MERLDQYLEANDIVGEGKQAKRRAVLISVMGPAAYKLARNLLSPAKPTEKTYEDSPDQTLQPSTHGSDAEVQV